VTAPRTQFCLVSSSPRQTLGATRLAPNPPVAGSASPCYFGHSAPHYFGCIYAYKGWRISLSCISANALCHIIWVAFTRLLVYSDGWDCGGRVEGWTTASHTTGPALPAAIPPRFARLILGINCFEVPGATTVAATAQAAARHALLRREFGEAVAQYNPSPPRKRAPRVSAPARYSWHVSWSSQSACCELI